MNLGLAQRQRRVDIDQSANFTQLVDELGRIVAELIDIGSLDTDLEGTAVLTISTNRRDIRDRCPQIRVFFQDGASSFHHFKLGVLTFFEFLDAKVNRSTGDISLPFATAPSVLTDDREVVQYPRQANQSLFDFR